jgi:hypothetical protein
VLGIPILFIIHIPKECKMAEMKIEFGEVQGIPMKNDLDEIIKAKDLICKIFMTNWG